MPKNLGDYTIDELSAELKKREEEALEAYMPKIRPMIDLIRDLPKFVSGYKNAITECLNDEEYDTQYDYEAVMCFIFGDDVFTWINEHTD